MDTIIAIARDNNPNFDILSTQQQYNILREINPRITPEDFIYQHEQQYYTVDVSDANWHYYTTNYYRRWK